MDKLETALFAVIRKNIIHPVAVSLGMKKSQENEHTYRTMLQVLKDIDYEEEEKNLKEGRKWEEKQMR